MTNALQWFGCCGWGGWDGVIVWDRGLDILQGGGILSSNVSEDDCPNVDDGSVCGLDRVLSLFDCWFADLTGA